MRLIAFVAIAWLILVDGAPAQSIEEVVRDFGFTGQWAEVCDQPASTTNWKRTIVVSAGEVSWTESCGKCNFQPVQYSVPTAKRVGTDRLEMRARRVNPDGTGWRSVYDLVMLKTGIRLRTMHYQAVGGTFITRDGRILGNGTETPWFTQCP